MFSLSSEPSLTVKIPFRDGDVLLQIRAILILVNVDMLVFSAIILLIYVKIQFTFFDNCTLYGNLC